jgi:hypothetical protein
MQITIGIIGLVLSLGVTILVVRRLDLRTKAKIEWNKVALFYGLMLLGMLAREGYNALVKTDASFNWTGLGIAAIVSPIVFGAIYANLGNLEVTIPSLVLAFQNGFFWNSIFESIPG